MSVLSESLEEIGEALPPMQVSRVPALFVKAVNSPYILPKDFSLIRAHFPNADIVTISQSGHWVHAEKPVVFFEKTLNFLKA